MIKDHGYCYFDRIITKILDRYDVNLEGAGIQQNASQLEADNIINNIDGLPENCIYELNRALFIPISPSFNQFVDGIELIDM
jgi:hypothetical protein